MNEQNPEEIDLEAERQKQSRYYMRDILVTVAIILIVTIWRAFSGDDGVGLTWDETSITAVCPDDTEFTMNYSDLISLEIGPVSDYGICISGEDGRNRRYGIWENEAWGDYELYASKAVNDCIVLQSADTVLVINYESDSSTVSLYEEIQNFSAVS